MTHKVRKLVKHQTDYYLKKLCQVSDTGKGGECHVSGKIIGKCFAQCILIFLDTAEQPDTGQCVSNHFFVWKHW